jgi:hypothetical protein
MPRTINRFGKCLAVLGHTPDHEARPQWTILDSSGFPELRELRVVQDLGDMSIWSSTRQEIDSTGAIYLAHPRGVSVVRGLFDGLGCL